MPFDSARYEPSDPVLRTITEARQWLNDPAHWSKRGMGSRAMGATCALGAIFDCPEHDARHEAADWLCLFRFGDTRWSRIASFNDDSRTTHADVLALFDQAIAARKAELLKTSEIGAVASNASA